MSQSSPLASPNVDAPQAGVSPAPARIRLTRPDDWHLHLRDGAVLRSVVMDSARQFGRAIIMPNLKPPVLTTEDARAYRDRILAALRQAHEQADGRGRADGGEASSFEPLMTLYLTDRTAPDEIRRARDSGFVHGVKLYPAGATTHSDAGVTDLLGQCAATLAAMQDCGMPLLVHGEVTDPAVDVFDREAVFIERVMVPLRRAFPALKVVFEHLTTADGAAYVAEADGPIGATLTPQHLLYNRNALFKGGLRPHWYCLPILKRETHRQALLAAATSGNPRFFLGTDSAPHPRGAKEQDCGCAGCYTARHAMALYAAAFESVGRLDRLEAFASLHGPAFYGLAPNAGTLTLERVADPVPRDLPLGDDVVVPLAAGESLAWRVSRDAE
ncbi:Dihydroorotase [Castellaniella defragrans 65Phen]|uniref:Dihydroorotase n=1 Tax=Castellaniella defragrans (strain DSM 12143 / CCUG 39792 / 65Phen) TaxID=1437824 RepID=W8X639_CASD6|nr:Dihydroorotase [Castellaniella defragrans 65Phen]